MNKQTSQEYYEWLSKFEAKKTTDDCYTPPLVYDAVLEYVDKEVVSLNGLNVVRPFYPGGDYQKDAQSYDDKTIVIDNPPFSIITPICKFYQENNIKFFLFAPALISIGITNSVAGTCIVCTDSVIVYGNGAKVKTGFVTNIIDDVIIKTAPKLQKLIEDAVKANCTKPKLPKYTYPNEVITVSRLHKLSSAGVEFELRTSDAHFVRKLDDQTHHKKTIFGSGFLVSETKAAELKAAELKVDEGRVIVWTLSERERAIVEALGAS